MIRKLMLTIAHSVLFVLAASGQDAGQTSAKFNESNAYVLEGKKLLDANKPEEALKAFQQAAQLSPWYGPAVMGQYNSLVQLKRENEATKILDDFLADLIAANPGDPQRWLGRAFAEVETNQPEKALMSFTKLTELEPDDGGHWVGRGQMLAALKRYDEALKAFDKAITLNPKDADAWINRGDFLLLLGKYDDAIKSYDKAVKLDAKWASLFYSRACAYAGKGNKTNALADLKTAIQRESSLQARAAKEDHFSSLRDDPDFKKLLESRPDR
jgi:tetratricopeptide (TPR) repeat protein